MLCGVKLFVGLFGSALFVIFIVGLSHRILVEFAGFFGGMPFMLVAIVVCAGALYYFWDECVRKK